MPRKKSLSQTAHHRRVQREAKKRKDKRCKVQAAGVRGYDQPDKVAGYVPDIIAIRGSRTTIIEVETPETLASHKKQIEAFRRHAAQKANTDFELIITRPRKKK